MLTQAKVKELFIYKDGFLYWKIKPAANTNIGGNAGHIKKDGYSIVAIKRKSYLVHRIIYLMHHGVLPREVDHKDTNPRNNRIENLRAATHAQNISNSKRRLTNTSGVRNVAWHKASNKWIVKVTVNAHQKHIGLFEDIELAELVAIEARIKHHGVFANHA
jgi:citrate synthase